MTTWTANNGNRVRDIEKLGGNCVAQTYSISAVSGDTGGTLTVGNMSVIDNCVVFGWRDTGPTTTEPQARISGNTVVVTHANPGENATVIIKVWGKR